MNVEVIFLIREDGLTNVLKWWINDQSSEPLSKKKLIFVKNSLIKSGMVYDCG